MTTMSLPDTFVARAEADREFWRGVLTAGGFTAIPRWTLHPVPGVGTHEEMIPGDLVAALRERAAEVGVPLGSVLLAAHAKVLAALSGESEIVTGYVAAARSRPLPCRLVTGPGSWRALLRDTHRAEWELLLHQDFPLGELQGELGLTGPSYEIVFDSVGDDGKLPIGTVLRVGIWPHRSQLVLRLRYQADVLDADAAARIAGYHLTALTLIAADPEAEHGRQGLLGAGELRCQLEGLAGPDRELPDRRVHELFEQRVRAHPDAIAAVHGDRQWTYRELNARANQLGRALLARGLRRESVVAVVTERNLDWMAAVLAVFKAGGVYLPIEPHFPADRIAITLSRAGCEFVLTEPGSTTTLGQALDSLPGVQALLVDAAYAENHADNDLGIAVGPDQLAYIYFTSGSTGEPKGAMCEHAGMLNHLFAKIDDLKIGEGHVIAQIAPQCFDISMWQLVSGLLVGGRTLLVEQEVILDVQRFLDKIVDGRVDVLQVVPSYLEVVLSYLEQHPRELPDLRCVSVTGEALKPGLVQRWFATEPGIKLVNAYGLTETSDDTNHEVMDRAPAGERVPLGRPIANVRVYVVDEHLSPVPLGAPGVIAFSGVCVGRGYINDPERTRLAYLADPHHAGQRLYLGGDYGRWQPDRKLELTRHPVLADMAGAVDGKSGQDGKSERRSGLLQPLLEPDGTRAGTLVCFPYAGGNAVNFQPMASALRGSGLAVYAVELPGHDLAAQDEPFAPMTQVADQVAAEIAGLGPGRVLLWGHSSGAAFAMATVAELAQRGVDVQRVFLGAQLPGDAAGRRAAITGLAGRSNAEIAAGLTAHDGYAGLGELDAQHAGQMGAAYRHDCVSAHRYLAGALDNPPTVKLSAPVTVVLAADDSHTAGLPGRHRDWQLLADHVDLHELADGGHYFPRTRPAEAARAVRQAILESAPRLAS